MISNEPIDLEVLPKKPRINYKPKNNYKAYIELENSITKLINDWWQNTYSNESNIIIESDKVEFCKRLVKEGLGYSIIPNSCIEGNETFYQYNLQDSNQDYIYRKTWLFCRESINVNSHVHKFIEFCENYFV